MRDSSDTRAAARPNIVVVLFDDLGYSDLGCYGGEIRTPNIDRIAAAGVRFEGMYNSARCCPSRASLMTGLYPPQAGIADFVSREPHPMRSPAHLGRLRDDCVTLAEVLAPAGYRCYYSGKWHLHSATDPVSRGFHEFYGYTLDHSHDQYDRNYYQRLPAGRTKKIHPPVGEFYATDAFTDYGIEFIERGKASGDPWFLFLGHSSPHFPLQAPRDMVDRYFETYLRGWDVLRRERFARMVDLGIAEPPRWRLSDRSEVPVDRDDIANGFAGRPNPAWNSLDLDRRRDLARRMAIFAAMVERVDQGIGRIVDHLEANGDYENTLFLITSDNGACYEWGPFGFDEESRTGVTRLHTGADLARMGGPGTYHSYGSGWANLSNTPFRMYKHFTNEGGVCAPLIASRPSGLRRESDGRTTEGRTGNARLPAGQSVESGSTAGGSLIAPIGCASGPAVGGVDGMDWIRGATHTIDLMPTLISASGADYPTHRNGFRIPALEGIDLLPAMSGGSLPVRTLFFSHQQARAVLRGRWKAVWGKRTADPLRWRLYDLAEDRCETHDVSDAHPDIVDELGRLWEDYRIRVGLEEFEPWKAPAEEDISD